MPAFETMDRRQYALLWERSGTNSYGEPTVSVGVELNPTVSDGGVRWVHKSQLMLDPLGNTIQVDATVVVNRDVEIGSIMWEGGLDDVPGTGTSGAPPDGQLMEVVTKDRATDLKNRYTRRTLGLKRFNGTLPTVA